MGALALVGAFVVFMAVLEYFAWEVNDVRCR
jgi:F0F1-type ATP synthase membrane subunit b/b'